VTVSQTPVSYTPYLLPNPVDQFVYEIDQCGGVMYAVGRVSAIKQGSQTYSRGGAFSFSPTNGTMTAWNPQANAPIRSIAFSPDCSVAYLGGEFTTIRGAAASHIAAVDTTTGNLVPGFNARAGGNVDTVERVFGNVLLGGDFGTVNGTTRVHLASVNPTTGALTSYLTLPAPGGKVWNTQISHAGDRMLLEGNFTAIGGVSRRVMAMLDLGQTSATLNPWYSPEFDQFCGDSGTGHFYIRDAAWSPDDGSIYTAATGAWPKGTRNDPTRSGLCDASAKFPATAGLVNHNWVMYTGCDSLYAVEASATTVYVGGHERWSSNPHGCDFQGAGGVPRPGIAALDNVDGSTLSWNPTRALGHGADDMLLTPAGLWVASDTWENGLAQQCGGLKNHGGICFFPN